MQMVKQKKEILSISKRAYQEQLMAGTSGNASVFDRETGLMAITPSSVDYSTMTMEDIVVMHLDGTLAEPNPNKPSSEWKMHAALYRGLSHVNAVLHTHSPYATGFAVANKEIPVILIEMIPFLNGDVKVCGFSLPGTEALGVRAVEYLKDRGACLMKSHGVLAVGDSLAQAHIRAVYVEDAAKIYHMARVIGEPQIIAQSEIDAMRKCMSGE